MTYRPSKKDRSCAESPDPPAGFDKAEGNKGGEDVDRAGGGDGLIPKVVDAGRDDGRANIGCEIVAGRSETEDVPDTDVGLQGESSLVKRSSWDGCCDIG